MVSVSVTLSEWLYRAVLGRSVLTLSRDYFRLRRPLERRIYELARKHCGRQPSWRISVDTLLKKSGSASPRRVFRAMLREIIKADHLPDYRLSEEPGDIIHVTPRRLIDRADTPVLSVDAGNSARAGAGLGHSRAGVRVESVVGKQRSCPPAGAGPGIPGLGRTSA